MNVFRNEQIEPFVVLKNIKNLAFKVTQSFNHYIYFEVQSSDLYESSEKWYQSLPKCRCNLAGVAQKNRKIGQNLRNCHFHFFSSHVHKSPNVLKRFLLILRHIQNANNCQDRGYAKFLPIDQSLKFVKNII